MITAPSICRSGFAALLLALALGGCAGDDDGHKALLGAWQMQAIDGEHVTGKAARLHFAPARLDARASCKSLDGAWRVDGGRLLAGPLAEKGISCLGPAGEQERALTALLAAAPELSLNADRLVLRSRGHKAEFVRIISHSSN